MGKSRLSFKTTVKLSMKGRWVTRVITVLLSAFSFALFALASMGYTYSRTDYYARAYLNYTNGGNHPYTLFIDETFSGGLEDPPRSCGSGVNYFGQDIIDIVEEQTQMSFIYGYSGDLRKQNLPMVELGNFSNAITSQMTIPHALNGYSLIGESEQYEEIGFEILEGRYPETVYEIAVSRTAFEAFEKFGYYDNNVNYVFLEGGCLNGVQIRAEDEDGYIFLNKENDEEYVTTQKQEIGTYSDLIGKEVVMYGDSETGELSTRAIFPVKIVGIVDTDIGGDRDGYNHMFYDAPVFLSVEYHNVFFGGGDDCCTMMIAPKITTFAQAKKCVEAVLAVREVYMAEAFAQYDVRFGMFGFLDIFNGRNLSHAAGGDNLITILFCGIGAIFGAFSVLLNGYLTGASIKLKRKEIGILRSMGAGEREILKIFLVEIAFSSVCIFLVALAISFGVYYGWLYRFCYIEKYQVASFQFSGWNALILAAISVIVPLLSALAPLRKFFKKPIVDNITGNTQKAKRV